MAAYLVANYTITNAAEYAAYTPAVIPLLVAAGVEVLAADHASEVIEGAARTSTIILKFPSKKALHAWYNSPEYQDIITHRTDNSEGMMVFVDEFTPPE